MTPALANTNTVPASGCPPTGESFPSSAGPGPDDRLQRQARGTARTLAVAAASPRFADRNRFESWTGTAPLDASRVSRTAPALAGREPADPADLQVSPGRDGGGVAFDTTGTYSRKLERMDELLGLYEAMQGGTASLRGVEVHLSSI